MAEQKEELVFTSRNQSIYESNVSETNTVSVRFEQPWDIDAVDYRVDLRRIEVFPERPLYFFGELVGVIPALTIDLDTAFEFYFDTSGKVGIEFGARADRGSINSSFTYVPSLTHADALRYPANVVAPALLTSDAAAIAGAFDTNPFGVSAYMDFLYRFGLQMDLGLRLFGNDIIPLSNPPLDINLPLDLPLLPQQRNPETPTEIEGTWRLVNYANTTFEAIEFVFADLIIDAIGNDFLAGQLLERVGVEAGIGGRYYALVLDILDALEVTLTVDPYKDKFEVVLGSTAIRSKDKKLDRSDSLLTYDLGSITFNIPTPLPSDDTLENGVLAGSDSDLILAPRFDLDGIAAYAATKATGYPIATEYNLYLGQMIQINISLLDIDVGPELRWRQDLELAPGALQVTLDFTDLQGGEAFVRIPDGIGGTTPVSSWTGAWSDVPQFSIEGPTIVTPTYSMASVLDNKTGFELGFGLDFLIGRLGLIIREEKTNLKLFNEELGPLFEISVTDQDFFPNNDLFFPVIDDAGIQISGYNQVTGTSILLDVEGSGTPGLSGFVTGANLHAPVAVIDDGYTVEKDGKLVFAPGELLLNDYDPDAFDTLRITSVSALRDETGTARGAVTLRADGSVVFDTAGMFDALRAEFVFGDDGLTVERETARVTFDYTVADVVGREDSTKVVIDVLGRNSPPVAADDFLSVTLPASGEALTFSTNLILANDRDPENPDFDPDSAEEPLFRITPSFGQATALGGSIRMGETDFTYLTLPPAAQTLTPGQVLFDSFTYEIRDPAMFDDEPGVTGTVNVAFVAPGGGQPLWQSADEISVTAGQGAVPVAFLLGTSIAGPVTVAVSAPVETGITLTGEVLTFTPETAAEPQIVMVSGTLNSAAPVTLTGEIISAVSDPGILGQTVSVDVTVEAPAVIVAAPSLTHLEGPVSATSLVTLGRAPAPGTEVVLTLSASDPANAAVISPAELSFTADNWQSGQPIIVTPVDDDIATGPQVIDIVLSLDPVLTTDPAFAKAPQTELTVTIVDDENAAPTARYDRATVAEDGIVLIDVLGNDTDADGDALTLLDVSAEGGTATVENGAVRYTPAADFFGIDILRYTVSDGALSAVAPVEVTVTPVDDVPVTTPGFRGGMEDTPIMVDLSEFVRDVDLEALTFGIAAEGGDAKLGNGTAVVEGSTLTFTPDADFFNAEALRDVAGALRLDAEGEAIYRFIDPADPAFVTWTVSDGTTELEQTLLFAIAPANDAPILPDQIVISADEDTTRTIDLTTEILAQAVDPEGGALDLVRVDVAQPAGAPQPFLHDPDAGTVTFDPAEFYSALAMGETTTARFSYAVKDEFGSASIGSVDVEIAGRNDAPTAISDGFVFQLPLQGGALTLGDPTTNDIDPEGEILNWTFGADSATSPTTGQSRLGANLTIESDGVATYTPNPDVLQNLGPVGVAFDSFDYLPVDADGLPGTTGSVTVALVGSESPPTLILSKNALDLQEGALNGAFQVGLSQAPSQPVTVSLTSIEPDQAFPSQDSVTFTPEDWAPQTVQVIAVDDGLRDGVRNTILQASIEPNTDPLFSNATFATQFISLRIEDLGPAIETSRSHVSIAENGAGETLAVWLTTEPDGPVKIRAAYDDRANFIVVPADLSFTDESYDTPQYVTILPVDDDVLDGVGLDLIRFEVVPGESDPGYHDATVATVLAIIEDDETAPFPEAPDLAPLVRVAAVEGDGLEGDFVEASIPLLLSREGDLSSASVVDWSVAGAGGAYAATADDFLGGIFPTGQIQFSPGVASVPIVIDVEPDFEEERDEWFAITLTPVENARTIGRDTEVSIRNDDGESGMAPPEALEIVLPSGGVAEGGTVTAELHRSVGSFEQSFTLASSDPNRVILPAEVTIPDGAASVSFEITAAENALDEGDQFVVISAADPNSAAYRIGGATLKIIDDEANSAPAAIDDAYATSDVSIADPEAMLQLDLLANDSDPDGDALRVVALDLDGFQGQLFEDAEGRLAYDTNGAFDGLAAGEMVTDSFRYQVSDPNGLTDEATVTIAVIGSGETAANRAPVALDDLTFVTSAGTPLVVADLLANDSDPDGDPLTVYALGTGQLAGSVEFIAGDSLVYDPSAAFDALADGEVGEDRFTYSVRDGRGGTATANVAITIVGREAGVNAAPVAADDDATTGKGSPVVIDVGANDFDPEGEMLVWSLDGAGPTVGAVTALGGALFQYTPGDTLAGLGAGEVIEDSFRYFTIDPSGRSTTAEVVIEISGEGPSGLPPVVGNDFATTDASSAIVIDVRGNDSDPEGGDLSWDAFDPLDALGGITSNGDGTFLYEPSAAFDDLEQGFFATDIFRYSVTDESGQSSDGLVIVTISGNAPPNEAPIGGADRGDTHEAAPLVIDVLINDVDSDGDRLSVFSIDAPLRGSVSLEGGGIRYAPTPGFLGSEVFGYTLTDGALSGTASVTVTVAPDGMVYVLGTGADEIFEGLEGREYFELGGGTDALLLTPGGSDGDVIHDFGAEDRLELEAVSPEEISIIAGASGAMLSIRRDGMPMADLDLFLSGDFIGDTWLLATEGDRSTITLGSNRVTTLSPDNDRYVTGDPGSNIVFTDAGNDLALTQGGTDILWGETGSDVLLGGAGADTLSGGEGNDLLSGGEGPDIFLFAQSEDSRFAIDTITDFETGQDRIFYQGFGTDPHTILDVSDGALIFFSETAGVKLEGVLADDLSATDLLSQTTETAFATLSTVTGHVLSDADDRFVTQDGGPNRVLARSGNDSVVTSDGDDEIDAGEGSDVVIAGAGADTIEGGQGNDELSGGEGPDVFVFRFGQETGFTVDTITDFEAAEDTVSLLSYGFTSQTDFGFVTLTEGVALQASSEHLIVFSGITDAVTLLESDVFQF